MGSVQPKEPFGYRTASGKKGFTTEDTEGAEERRGQLCDLSLAELGNSILVAVGEPTVALLRAQTLEVEMRVAA